MSGHEFVALDLVSGPLRGGFDAFADATDPILRAVALMFLVAECHPFDDGNGRVARIEPSPSRKSGTVEAVRAKDEEDP